MNPPKAKKKKKEDSSIREELLTNMSKIMHQRLERIPTSNERNPDDVFGTMVSSELTKLPEFLKIQAKHEINNVIFKFEMQSQKITNFPLNYFTSATNSTSSNPQLGSPSTQATPTMPSNNHQVGNWCLLQIL